MRIGQLAKNLNMEPVSLAGLVTSTGYRTSESTAKRWMDGDITPRAEALPFIAKALSCDISDLYDETDASIVSGVAE